MAKFKRKYTLGEEIFNFDEGEIYVDGVSVKEKPLECKRKIAYIPDNPDLYEFMTGIKYLNFIADIFGISQSDRQARITPFSSGSIMDDWLRSCRTTAGIQSSAWAARIIRRTPFQTHHLDRSLSNSSRHCQLDVPLQKADAGTQNVKVMAENQHQRLE